jgi:hypothetical protein
MRILPYFTSIAKSHKRVKYFTRTSKLKKSFTLAKNLQLKLDPFVNPCYNINNEKDQPPTRARARTPPTIYKKTLQNHPNSIPKRHPYPPFLPHINHKTKSLPLGRPLKYSNSITNSTLPNNSNGPPTIHKVQFPSLVK